MIAFATLWLGIVAGALPVQVLAGPEVARVELRLDGETMATLAAPPWKTTLELGPEIAPHELVAVAYDAAGRPLGEARQILNMPRPTAELELALSRATGGGVEVRLAWASIGSAVPTAVRASLDGEALPDSPDPGLLRLPPLASGVPHLLRIEADFPGGGSTSREVMLGGELSAELSVELTGVPLELAGRREPPRTTLRLVAAGEPLEVVGLDRGLADLVAVVDPAAQRELAEVVRRASRRQIQLGGGPGLNSMRQRVDTRFLAPLDEDHRLRMVLPIAERDARFELFPISAEFSPAQAGLLTYLATAASVEGVVPRLADAVAVAAVTATREGRRRAVLLVVAPGTEDASLYSAAAVRRYLARLSVPLVVWVTGEPTAELLADWGGVRRADSVASLENAARELGQRLDRQRMAWVEGSHLPHRLTLDAGANTGLSIAGRDAQTAELPDAELAAAAAAIAERDEEHRLVEAERQAAEAAGDEEEAIPQGLETRPLGPFVVATDVRDERLLARLESVATTLAPSYRQRFGLEAEPTGTVLLFAREKGFRSWLAARSATEGGPADSGLEGFATSGTAALHAGQRLADEVAGLLVHELTHLLTQSATERQLAPWLEEGLAEELAMSRLDREGRVIAGSLRTERTVRADGPSRFERIVSGPGAALVRLVGTPGALVPLDALLAFDAETFFHPAGRADRYATAGFLVRFLLAEEPRAARFRSFLAEAAAGAAADAPALEAALGEPLAALEPELMRWLRHTALAGGG